MALTPGTRLGPYEITAQIGVGGMGERLQVGFLRRHLASEVLARYRSRLATTHMVLQSAWVRRPRRM